VTWQYPTSPAAGGTPGGAAGGDLTGTYPNPTLAAAGGGAAGPTGSATVTPIVTVDAKGRVLALSSATTVPTNAAGGDLTGNYPNPTLAAVLTAGGPTGSSTVVPVITWDAKGRLTAVSSANIAAGGVTELAYVEATGAVAVTATAEGSANTVLSAGALTFNGSTRVLIEFYSYQVQAGVAGVTIVVLYEDSTSIGRWGYVQNGGNTQAATESMYLKRFLTPASGTKTYSARAYRAVVDGVVNAGAGGSGNGMPMFIRVTSGS
jgi:hypothetical protein